MPATSARPPRRISLVWLLGFVVFMAAIAASLFYARHHALETLGDESSRQEWQDWKDEVREQQQRKTSPVERRVTRSDEPPTLVMLRDSFLPILLVCLLAGTVFYGFLMFVVRGMRSGKPVQSDDDRAQ